MKSHAIETQLGRCIVPLVAALFLTGCSGPPSESVGRQIVQKQVQAESKGFMKLVSFRKTNATGGNSSYRMEYEAEVEFTADATVMKSASISGPFHAMPGLIESSWFTEAQGGIEQKRNGEKMKRAWVLTFEKTEKGWRGPDGNVY